MPTERDTSSTWIPDTEEVRDVFADPAEAVFPIGYEERSRAFDRWIEAIRADERAKVRSNNGDRNPEPPATINPEWMVDLRKDRPKRRGS